MPEFDLLLDDDDDQPLFTVDDPLTFTLPDPESGAMRQFHAVDRPAFPDDRYVNFGNQPRSASIEMMAKQVIEDEQPALRKILHKLFDEALIEVDKMTELADWLTDQRDKARKRLAKKKLHRPTGAPSRSTPSSSIGAGTSEAGFS